jgi:hypothetical protein
MYYSIIYTEPLCPGLDRSSLGYCLTIREAAAAAAAVGAEEVGFRRSIPDSGALRLSIQRLNT